MNEYKNRHRDTYIFNTDNGLYISAESVAKQALLYCKQDKQKAITLIQGCVKAGCFQDKIIQIIGA